MAIIRTMDELDQYYHDPELHALNFRHISDTVQAIRRGRNDRLLPLFLSTIPLITPNNISELVTTLRETPHFEFNALNIHGIIESIQDEPDYYELAPDVKERLLQHFVSVLPLDTPEGIDEFMDSSDVSIDPIYHENIVRNVSQHGPALLAHYLFKKGVIIHGINEYVDEFLRTFHFDNLDDVGKQTALFILNEMLEDRLTSPENRERINVIKGAHYLPRGNLRRTRAKRIERLVSNQATTQLVDRRRRKRSRFKHLSTVRARLSSK